MCADTVHKTFRNTLSPCDVRVTSGVHSQNSQTRKNEYLKFLFMFNRSKHNVADLERKLLHDLCNFESAPADSELYNASTKWKTIQRFMINVSMQ